MATITELKERLAQYRAAEARILTGAQETSVGDQRARQAELANIQSQIRELENRIALAEASQGGPRLTHSQAVFGGRR
jgi:primosomal protein N''